MVREGGGGSRNDHEEGREGSRNDHVVTWTEMYFASEKDCVNSQFEQLHDKFLRMVVGEGVLD